MADLTGMLQAAAGAGGPAFNPRDYFNTVLYTGTGSAQSITGVGFQPDWVWIKERIGSADHGLYDAVRGVQNQLESNTTTAETTESTGLTAFGSDGFTVGALAQLNTNTDTYVAWNWNAGGSNATNTDGTITSTVRANPTAGFSIATYTGNGTTGTIGHGLNAMPAMVITKMRVANSGGSSTSNWIVYHKGLSGNVSGDNPWSIYLNTTDAEQDLVAFGAYNDITTSVIPVTRTSAFNAHNNNNTSTYVAYCFAEVEGFSKFGSYTGNGSATGPSITTNFQPTWLMIKRTNSTGDWILLDSARDSTNPRTVFLEPNTADEEATGNDVDFNSTGFQLKSTSASINASGSTYIYACFA